VPTVNTSLTPITIATTGATGIGTATGLPTGVTAAWSADVITLSGTPSVTGTYTYTIPLTGGCGTVNATGSIVVCALNTAGTPSSSPSATLNAVLTPITIATTGATGIGTATGLPTGVTAAWSANVITLSGTPSVAGTFNYSILLTGGCGTVNATGSITVTAFNCGTTTITDINNNSYNTVAIGTQCWTKENLKVTMYNDGTAITFNNTYTSGTSSTVWQGYTIGAYAIYGNETSSGTNATNYGFLYNWYAATSSKKLCPVGWRVPSDSDWNKLVKSIDSGSDTTAITIQSTAAGIKLKSSTLWSAKPGTEPNGFSAPPGGGRHDGGYYVNVTTNAFFWGATAADSVRAWVRNLTMYDENVYRYGFNKAFGGSVRCLRD
jgi:uncharacterized protein (TIGR02145 family)